MALTRRQMVAAAGGVVTGASIMGLGKIVEAQRGAAPPRPEDKFLLHIGKENARLIKLARQGRLRSEHMQSLAANLKLWALTLNDAEFKAAAVKARGNPAFGLTDHTQHARQAAEVKKMLDLDITEDLATMPIVQPAQRTAALATLAREGLTPTLLKAAASMEAQAAQMAVREKDGSERFQLVQDGVTAPYCAYYPHLETAFDITCTVLVWYGPQGVASCIVALVWKLAWKYVCI